MCAIHPQLGRLKQSELERVIESLAGYICAADQPRAAMKSALASIVTTVAEINRAASRHVATFTEIRS